VTGPSHCVCVFVFVSTCFGAARNCVLRGKYHRRLLSVIDLHETKPPFVYNPQVIET
jgi:hypothetical protein